MSTVTRFKAWLERHHPAALATFSGPAPAKEVARLRRALSGVKTAGSLLELHRTLGGQRDHDRKGQLFLNKGVHGFDAFLTVERLFETKASLDGMARIGEWDDERTRWLSWWVVGWVPVLEDFSNDSICIDTRGTFGGAAGQVLRFRHDGAARTLLAPSFDAWFEALVSSFEAGLWSTERGEPHPLEPRAVAKHFRARLPGYPREHKALKERPATKSPTATPARRRGAPSKR